MDFKDLFAEKEIPDLFKTYVSEENFTYCINCEKYLLDSGTNYMIEKVINKGNVEFEHAICIDCAQELKTNMSEDSMTKVNEFFSTKFDENKRITELLTKDEHSIDNWLDKCVISDENISDIEEYQIYAHCNGKNMVYSHLPFLISSKVLENVNEMLSAKTKEELDNYMDKHFRLPPEWKESFINKKVFII
jgi:hypothetical protein